MCELIGPNETRIECDAANSTYFDNHTGTGSSESPPTEAGKTALQAAFTITICSLIIFGTILGNSLVCGAVAITRKLRTPSNLLIVSLAISDLLVGALDMPFAVMYEVTGKWEIGEGMCDFWTSIDVLFCTASILNICVISVDRYLVITKPFQYAMKRTPLRMFLMIGLVWMVSAIISIPPLFGWKKPAQPNECMVSQDKGYQFFATIGAFYLPLVIMVVIYTRIYMVSSKMTNSNPRPSGAPSSSSSSNFRTSNGNGRYGSGRYGNGRHGNGHPAGLATTMPVSEMTLFQEIPREEETTPSVGKALNGVSGHNGHLNTLAAGLLAPVTPIASVTQTRKRGRSNSGALVEALLRLNCRHRGLRGGIRGNERKATRTLGVIMGAFVACWLPFFILALIRPFCHDPVTCIPQWLNSLLLWLGFTNSLLNPVIYARFNREFRTPFKYILQCRCANINSHLRSEDFTEQFGRTPVSHHNCQYPPPLPAPPPGAFTRSDRLDTLYLPRISIPQSTPSPVTSSSRQSSICSPPVVDLSPSMTSHPPRSSQSHLIFSSSSTSSRLPPSPSPPPLPSPAENPESQPEQQQQQPQPQQQQPQISGMKRQRSRMANGVSVTFSDSQFVEANTPDGHDDDADDGDDVSPSLAPPPPPPTPLLPDSPFVAKFPETVPLEIRVLLTESKDIDGNTNSMIGYTQSKACV